MAADGNYFQTLSANPRGRDIVIGDIHGHFTRVEHELERIGFDPGRDRLICCGDLVDRGPESALASEWLEQEWFFAAMGNHDASLLQRCGLLSGKFELWHDYHGWFKKLDRPAQHRLRDRLAALPWALQIQTREGTLGVVHAEVPPVFSSWQEFLAELGDEDVRCLAASSRVLAREALDMGAEGADVEFRLAGVDWVVQGHTPRRGCLPGQLGNRLWIDTMGWYERPLDHGSAHFTLIDVNDPLNPL